MLTFIRAIQFKGHEISQIESTMQRFFIIDGHLEAATWSIADAKRAIKGQPLKEQTVDIRDLARKTLSR